MIMPARLAHPNLRMHADHAANHASIGCVFLIISFYSVRGRVCH